MKAVEQHSTHVLLGQHSSKSLNKSNIFFLWFSQDFPMPRRTKAGRRLARSTGGAALRPAEHRSAARTRTDAERRGGMSGLV